MFKQCAVAAFVIATVGLPGSSAYAETADRFWSGGPTIAHTDTAMRAEVVAGKAGAIIAVGSTADVMEFKGESAPLINFAGAP